MDKEQTFEERMARIFEATGITSDSALARALEIRPPSVAAARKRRQIPSGWIEKIAEKFEVKADWLFFGRGPVRETTYSSSSASGGENQIVSLKAKIEALEKRLREKDETIQVLTRTVNTLHDSVEGVEGIPEREENQERVGP